jgi:serine/threonine protein phosphatase PrpC
VGVTCEPEIFETRITDSDKFIVLASDGVWEFLSNDDVLNLVIPHWLNGNPESACDKIIKEATNRWK